MAIRRIECEGWEEFKHDYSSSLFGDAPVRRGMYLFRGQRKHEWRLESSFDRWFKSQGIPAPMRIQTANELLKFFREELIELHHGVLSSAPSDSDVDKQRSLVDLALAQHHGLPTRLLDWTESPYVAAFFAFLEAATETPARDLPDDRVAVWALDRSSEAWSADVGVEVVTVPRIDNARLRNQEGHFTLSRSPFPDLESYLEAVEGRGTVSGGKPSLIQFSIPAKEAENALAELDVMGIKPSRLYPDISGCVVSAMLKSRMVNIYSQIRRH